MSKNLFFTNASCVKEILQALCHVAQWQAFRGFGGEGEEIGCTGENSLLSRCCWANSNFYWS